MGPEVNGSCGGLSYSTTSRQLIPSNDTLAIATYRGSSNTTLHDEPRYLALSSCCDPNKASKVDSDCIIWCNLPPQYVNDTDGFSDCFTNMLSHYNKEKNQTASGGFMTVYNSTSQDQESGGPSKSPSVATMFTLLTLFCSFTFL
jgi:hypothetical protein